MAWTRTFMNERGPDPLVLSAIAGIATVFALGFGTLLGLIVLLVLNTGPVAEPTVVETVAETIPQTNPQPDAARPSAPGRVTLETRAAPPIPGRPASRGGALATLLQDLEYERRLMAEPPPPTQAAPKPPPSILSGLWSMILRTLGFGDAPAPVEDVPLVIPIDPEPLRVPPKPEPVASVTIDERAPTPSARPTPAARPSAAAPPRRAPPPPADAVPRAVPAPRPTPAPVPSGPIVADDDEFDDFLEASFNEADLFIAPGADEEPTPDQAALERLDAIETILVQVSVDTRDVPIRVDGREVGVVPGTIQVPAGTHKVELYFKGQFTEFELDARRDPESWCFERRGRSFRQIGC